MGALPVNPYQKEADIELFYQTFLQTKENEDTFKIYSDEDCYRVEFDTQAPNTCDLIPIIQDNEWILFKERYIRSLSGMPIFFKRDANYEQFLLYKQILPQFD